MNVSITYFICMPDSGNQNKRKMERQFAENSKKPTQNHVVIMTHVRGGRNVDNLKMM